MIAQAAEKNLALFESLDVMTREETLARCCAMHELYSGVVEMELKVMLEMIQKQVLPASKASGVVPQATLDALMAGCEALEKELHTMEAAGSEYETATVARVARLETMVALREHCDAAEALVPAGMWTIATYQELLFLDFTMGQTAPKE